METMLSEVKNKKITWFNLESPTKSEVLGLREKYGFHILVAEELLQPTTRPKADLYDKTIYLILHFPVYDAQKRTSLAKEIDFVIGKNFIITVSYEPIAILSEFFKLVEVDSLLRKKVLGENGGLAFFYILKHLYNFSLRETDHLQQKIEKIEEDIFRGEEKKMVKAISFVKRDILDFRRSVEPHGLILKSLGPGALKIFGQKFAPYLNDLLGEHFKVKNIIESQGETVDALNRTNESLLTTKTNEIMKILTIMAFITFPLMILSSLFGMNTSFLPLVGTKGDFWIIVGIMLIATFGMFLFFKAKKWI